LLRGVVEESGASNDAAGAAKGSCEHGVATRPAAPRAMCFPAVHPGRRRSRRAPPPFPRACHRARRPPARSASRVAAARGAAGL